MGWASIVIGLLQIAPALITSVAGVVKAVEKEVKGPGQGAIKKQMALDMISNLYDAADIADGEQDASVGKVPKDKVMSVASGMIDVTVGVLNTVGEFTK